MNEEVADILSKVDWKKAKECPCVKCGCSMYKTGYNIRKVLQEDSPNDQELIIPFRVFSCDNCGYVDEKLQIITNY